MPTITHRLFAEMSCRFPASAYPPDMAPIAAVNSYRGFFPSASGFWRDAPNTREAEWIFFGQDFGNASTLKAALHGESAAEGTWKHLLEVLARANVPPRRCFFTNALVGIRTTTDKITGRSPGMADKTFIRRCADFMAGQIEALNPKTIVLLGKESAEVFEHVAAVAGLAWPIGKPKFRAWDLATGAQPIWIEFAGRRRRVIRLLHPSFRQPNRRFRTNCAFGICDVAAVDSFEAALISRR